MLESINGVSYTQTQDSDTGSFEPLDSFVANYEMVQECLSRLHI